MNRDTWKFEYSAEELLDAAQEKAEYHRKRRSFWEFEFADAERALMEKGIEITKHMVTGGSRVEVKGNQEYVDRYAECDRKLQIHKGKAQDYERYIRAFEHAEGRGVLLPYTLDIRDIEFFGL